MIVPKIMELILENSKLSELEETEQFYSSRVYALLEEEETKLWRLNTLTLYNVYEGRTKNRKDYISGGGMRAMRSQMHYLIFCMEQYKLHKHLSGKEVAELFKQYRVYEYILSCFDALRTTGTEYVMDDIDMYIDARIAAAKQ